MKIHRLSYALAYGLDIDAFPKIDHLCRVRHCGQPTHLEAVGQPENVRRGDTGRHNRVKTRCPRGHSYSERNTYVNPRGSRICRACALDAGRDYEARNPGRARGRA